MSMEEAAAERCPCPTFGTAAYQQCDCKVCKPGERYAPRRESAEIVSPALAVGPYTVRETKGVLTQVVAGNKVLAEVFFSGGATAGAQAQLFAASWDLLAACEKAAQVMGWMLWDQSDRRDKNEAYSAVLAAIARARGLRPCDVPSLVPGVMQAQPQCVHGEKWTPSRAVDICPAHGTATRVERRENPFGGWWYVHACAGNLEEMKGSGG